MCVIAIVPCTLLRHPLIANPGLCILLLHPLLANACQCLSCNACLVFYYALPRFTMSCSRHLEGTFFLLLLGPFCNELRVKFVTADPHQLIGAWRVDGAFARCSKGASRAAFLFSFLC